MPCFRRNLSKTLNVMSCRRGVVNILLKKLYGVCDIYSTVCDVSLLKFDFE